MSKRKRLGDILIEAGAIDHTQLAAALEDQKRYGGKLGDILLDRNFITERDYFKALTGQLGVPAVDFTQSAIPESVIKMVPKDLAERLTVFPVAVKRPPQGNVLVLAMSDPTNVEIQDEVRFTIGCKVEPALALESTLRQVISDYYYHWEGKGSYRLERDMAIDEVDIDSGGSLELTHSRVSEVEDPHTLMKQEDNGPVIDRLGDEKSAEDKPNLNRELKALLKLLARKGILTPKEYLEIFKETE